VNRDGSLVVREDVTFDFRGAHQGIFRRIPLSYTREGFEYPHILSGIGVYDDANHPLRTEVSYPNGSVVIKAWVPGAVNTKKTVSFVYHVRRGVLGYADHDELYWNATGTEWNVPIAAAEVYVTLPTGIGDAEVRTAGFTGPLGVAGRMAVAWLLTLPAGAVVGAAAAAAAASGTAGTVLVAAVLVIAAGVIHGLSRRRPVTAATVNDAPPARPLAAAHAHAAA